MNIFTLFLAILSLLNALVTIAGAIYAFTTIRGTTAGLWMTSQILGVSLTLATPFILAWSHNRFNTDLQTTVLSQNALIGLVSLITSVLFILLVARIERLKRSAPPSGGPFGI